jgi:hypothetical protein
MGTSMIYLDRKRENPLMVVLASAGEDLELQGIAHMMAVLEALDDAGRRRAIDYLRDRYVGNGASNGR